MKNKLNTDYANRGHFVGWGSSPDTDWRIMFSFFLLLLVMVAIISTLTFSQAKSGGLSTNNIERPLIDSALLHKTAIFYEGQKLDFAKFQSLPETIPDPSL